MNPLELNSAISLSSDNNIGSEGAAALAAALKENKTLQALHLDSMSLKIIPIPHTAVKEEDLWDSYIF